MSDQTILCPKCHTSISVADSLSAQIRQELEADVLKKQAEHLKKLELQQKELVAKELEIKKQQEQLSAQVEEQLQKEKEKIWAIAQQKAKEKVEAEAGSKLKELEEENKKKTEELRKAEQQELELRKKSREIEEKAAKMELEVQRQLDEERRKIAEQAKRLADDEHRLKMLEKDKQLDMMRHQIEELKRKSEQGSMQIQGEVQEEDLKQILQTAFPTDTIEDVEKGIKGADLIQTVISPFGQKCGVILWESKNVKSWKDEWVTKLKEDQNIVKADVCVIVTKVLPKGADNFAHIQNVWAVDYNSVLLLTQALRLQLQQVFQVQNSLVGREEKMEVLYGYLSSPQFKNRVENIVSAFLSLQEQLTKEKRSMQVIWSRREKEIERVINNTTGFYGDLQGIIGSALPSVEHLELPEESESLQAQEGLF